MRIKKFSDYEKLFFENIGNKTIKELIDNFHLSEYANPYNAESLLMGLKDLSDGLESEFFRSALKEKEFLDIPIIAVTHKNDDDNDIYSLMVEEIYAGYYKTIHFNLTAGSCSFSLQLLPGADQIIDLEGCKTIGDFINKYAK